MPTLRESLIDRIASDYESPVGSLSSHRSDQDERLLARLRATIERLDPADADLLELYYLRGCRQRDIAQLFGVTQPTICSRLQTATERLRLALAVPVLDESEVRRDVAGVLDVLSTDILVRYLRTGNQTWVARELGRRQQLVRHRLIRARARLDAAGLDHLVRALDGLFAGYGRMWRGEPWRGARARSGAVID